MNTESLCNKGENACCNAKKRKIENVEEIEDKKEKEKQKHITIEIQTANDSTTCGIYLNDLSNLLDPETYEYIKKEVVEKERADVILNRCWMSYDISYACWALDVFEIDDDDPDAYCHHNVNRVLIW